MKTPPRYLILGFWLYVVVLAILNLKPGNPEAPETGEFLFLRRDYFHHILAYMVLSGWYGICMVVSRPVFRRRPLLNGAFLLLGLAVILEGLQFFIPHRRFNWYDLLANASGVAIGLVLAAVTGWVRRKLKTINNK
jgi:VanZ family protein